jgi:hypothetical protein
MTERQPGLDAEDDTALDAGERKERVLHTRVPDSLDRHIKRRARSLGMSASTVVRNVLLTTFGLVEDIVNDSTDIALAATGLATSPRRDRSRAAAGTPAGEVVAWQDAVLNLNAVCDQCNAILQKGSRAGIGVREQPGPRAIICPQCLAALSRGGRRAVKARDDGPPAPHPARTPSPTARRATAPSCCSCTAWPAA